jgi:hypothetical protein
MLLERRRDRERGEKPETEGERLARPSKNASTSQDGKYQSVKIGCFFTDSAPGRSGKLCDAQYAAPFGCAFNLLQREGGSIRQNSAVQDPRRRTLLWQVLLSIWLAKDN